MNTPSRRPDAWTSGNGYESYVGRWSRCVAPAFLTWLDRPSGGRWLDVGCGTGALTATILDRCAPAAVLGIDRSADYVAYARDRLADSRARFELGDAAALPIAGASVETAVSGLVLNFVPQPERAVAEMRRVLRPDGIAAVYVWDYAGEMGIMQRFWDAAVALDPAARSLDEGVRFPLCRPDALERLFRDAGFADVEIQPIEITMTFRGFDDYWAPFLSGQGPAPGYAMSLGADRREALRERIAATLPIAPDGSIDLAARAWAVRGRRAIG
jgi:SAM-dependent methyltransferase